MDPLKQKFHSKSQSLMKELKALRKEKGDLKIGEVNLKQVLTGMRGVKSLVWETSNLDPIQGIRFRGYTISELKELLPNKKGDSQPLPEGLFWLMLVDEIPSHDEVAWLSSEWNKRSKVPKHTFNVIDQLPIDTHPMTQFCIAIQSLQTESIFAKKYFEGMNKVDYWDPAYEDSMNLIAKLPRIAAYIYRRSFHNGDHIEPDPSLDWAGNFAHMLGIENEDFKSLMRLYLTVHADHEGGNASAHTVHLVNSALSDVYYSFAAGMSALAGPLHGLANQEVIKFIYELVEEIGTSKPTKEQLADYVNETLQQGRVIPGYGHAVLRQPDPRFMAQKEFAEQYIKNSDYVQIVWDLFEVVPNILDGLGKVANPWPNVDAHSGAILVHYGLKEYIYYTVIFGVARSLGTLSASCWSRAFGFPLERPKSVTSKWLKDYVKSI